MNTIDKQMGEVEKKVEDMDNEEQEKEELMSKWERRRERMGVRPRTAHSQVMGEFGFNANERNEEVARCIAKRGYPYSQVFMPIEAMLNTWEAYSPHPRADSPRSVVSSFLPDRIRFVSDGSMVGIDWGWMDEMLQYVGGITLFV